MRPLPLRGSLRGALRGATGRFYAPSPGFGGTLVRVAIVGAVVTAAAWVARSRLGAPTRAPRGVSTERAEEPWPFPTAERHPEPSATAKSVHDEPSKSLADPASHAV